MALKLTSGGSVRRGGLVCGDIDGCWWIGWGGGDARCSYDGNGQKKREKKRVDKKQSRRAALGGSVELEEADGLGKAREVVVAVVVVKGEVRQEQQEQQQQQQTAAGGWDRASPDV
jgi:hypothetical protein